jgi:FAD/FMN-containing dehydrogenase
VESSFPVVPSGVARADVNQAVKAFVAALGSDAVITDPDGLREFRDPYSFRESDEFDASVVVLPTTVEQIQAIVRIANEHRLPLWTFSQGRNNTYGGPAPRVRGAALVNLRKMNRILEIEADLAYAVVEPGVRWFDLHDALEAAGGRLWPSIPDLGWGSVVGNSLEYGIGYMPHGDHASHVCGMEVVLANGEVLRTGMGAITGGRAWHVYPHSFGPSLEGLFKQSSLGIVTKLGVWLMPRPETYASCWVQFSGYDRLEKVVNALREMMLDRIIVNHPMMTRGLEIDADGNPYLDPTSDTWHARFALYGLTDLVEAHFRVVERALGRISGTHTGRRNFAGDDKEGPGNHDARVQRGIPDMDLLDERLLPYGADTGHLDFSPIGRCVGSEVVELEKLVRSLYERRRHPYVGGVFLGPRSALHVSTTFYDTTDKAQTEAVYEAYSEMVVEVAKFGCVPYRTNLQNMDLVAEQLEFGDHALLRFNETIKDAVDPNGILSPGKQGVWPAARRQR